MRKEPKNRHFRLFCIFAVAMASVGCGVVSDRYQAKDTSVAFKDAYQKHLNDKYASPAGPNRFQQYDELLTKTTADMNVARENDKRRLAELAQQRGIVENALSGTRADLAGIAAKAKIHRRTVAELEAKKGRLSAKPEKYQDDLDRIEHQLNQLIISSEQIVYKEQDLLLRSTSQQEQLEQLKKEMATVASRDYFTVTDMQRRTLRNEIVHEWLLDADIAYLELKNSLLMGRASGDTLLDISELMLSTATTLSGGVMAKANLGAASTLLKGSRTSVDKNFFAQQALAAILNAIEDRRQLDKIEILKGLAKSTTEYPLQQGLADVRLYQSRANLMSGVLALANQTATNAKNSEKELEDQKKGQKEGKETRALAAPND